MGDATFKATEDELKGAAMGLRIQAFSHGFNPDAPKMAKFLDHMAGVIAQHIAAERFLQNIIHQPHFGDKDE